MLCRIMPYCTITYNTFTYLDTHTDVRPKLPHPSAGLGYPTHPGIAEVGQGREGEEARLSRGVLISPRVPALYICSPIKLQQTQLQLTSNRTILYDYAV